MDALYLIISLLFCLIGIIGSFIPVIPGPITSWLGLLFLDFNSEISLNFYFLLGSFIIAISVFILDLIIPLIGIKKLGGTQKGIIGAAIGLLIGLLIGPLGILLGPFIGALSGELTNNMGLKKAVKASVGTLIGFLAGIVMKFTVSFIFLVIYVKETLTIIF
tara:strand:- start:3 stop:488 length:486 start_codon:yes stop_codon:yes gene_type:complete